jgi:hypothetical protein
MGQKDRHSIKESTPSIRSLSSSVVSASDVSSDDGSSVHERSTPKIAAIIIASVFVIAILVGVTVYLIDAKKLFGVGVDETVVVLQVLPENKTKIGNNESLKQLLQSSTQSPEILENENVDLNFRENVELDFKEETFYDEVKPTDDAADVEETAEKVKQYFDWFVLHFSYSLE